MMRTLVTAAIIVCGLCIFGYLGLRWAISSRPKVDDTASVKQDDAGLPPVFVQSDREIEAAVERFGGWAEKDRGANYVMNSVFLTSGLVLSFVVTVLASIQTYYQRPEMPPEARLNAKRAFALMLTIAVVSGLVTLIGGLNTALHPSESHTRAALFSNAFDQFRFKYRKDRFKQIDSLKGKPDYASRMLDWADGERADLKVLEDAWQSGEKSPPKAAGKL